MSIHRSTLVYRATPNSRLIDRVVGLYRSFFDSDGMQSR